MIKNYKGFSINMNQDGKFYTSIAGKIVTRTSLKSIENAIDKSLTVTKVPVRFLKVRRHSIGDVEDMTIVDVEVKPRTKYGEPLITTQSGGQTWLRYSEFFVPFDEELKAKADEMYARKRAFEDAIEAEWKEVVKGLSPLTIDDVRAQVVREEVVTATS